MSGEGLTFTAFGGINNRLLSKGVVAGLALVHSVIGGNDNNSISYVTATNTTAGVVTAKFYTSLGDVNTPLTGSIILPPNYTLIYEGDKISIYDDNGITGGSSGIGGEDFSYAEDEVPAGTRDGVNASFTLSHYPVIGSLKVYLNGQKLTKGTDFSYVGNTLTMINIPHNSDVFTVNYKYY